MDGSNPIDVLIVDDDAAVRTSFASILHSAGYHVADAADGHSALGVLGRNDCKVLMTDVDMPTMSGVELLALLPHEERPLVLVVSASDLTPEVLHSMPRAVFGYLRKPVDPGHLRSLVAEAVSCATPQP